MSKELSVIIVNYNGGKYLKDCLEAIKNNLKDINYEIIIVDNNSNDDSIELLQANYNEEIILIKSSINLGFAKGNNLGVKKSNGKYVLLLNNDTILKNSIKLALNIFKKQDVGIVGIKMLGKKNEYRNSVGHFPSPNRLIKLSRLYKINNEFRSGEFINDIYEVDWVEGSFLLTTRKVWDLVNGLDEDYFMYVEDVDFCKKVSLNNYKVVYLPLLEYIHFGGYGANRENLLKKGFKIYINKYYKGINRVLCLLSVSINFIIKDVKKTIKKIT